MITSKSYTVHREDFSSKGCIFVHLVVTDREQQQSEQKVMVVDSATQTDEAGTNPALKRKPRKSTNQQKKNKSATGNKCIVMSTPCRLLKYNMTELKFILYTFIMIETADR